MINEILIKGKKYKLVCKWRKTKKDKTVDSKGELYPYPKKSNKWSGQEQFIVKLAQLQKRLNKKIECKSCKCCLLCDDNVKCDIYSFVYGSYIWDSTLLHYVKQHNIKPPEEFIDKVFGYSGKEKDELKLTGRIKQISEKKYIKLDKNQIMILDALMKHGGYSKKYYDVKHNNVLRYSEHAGFFDITGNIIKNVIVSGNTIRVDKGDEEIFLPISSKEAYSYKYIFHTHPPTPKPGGRVKDGILYEFPSIGDILHFIDHHNDGKTNGSFVMTPEGLYNIRKYENDDKNIEINEDNLYDDLRLLFRKIQDIAIKKYGTNFNTYKFYSTISQDTKYLENINDLLKTYHLFIDFYPRTKDFRGSWVVDTVYILL